MLGTDLVEDSERSVKPEAVFPTGPTFRHKTTGVTWPTHCESVVSQGTNNGQMMERFISVLQVPGVQNGKFQKNGGSHIFDIRF